MNLIMDLFSAIGFLFAFYYFITLFILFFVDCDLQLFWYQYFGKKLSVLKDKVIWITGASSGIGEYLAIEVAKHGAKVILSARTLENLERVKNLCVVESGAKIENITILQFNVTEIEKHEEIFEMAVKCFGKIDILVNNAGRSQRAAWEDISIEVDKEMLNLNLLSKLSLSRLAVKYFKRENIYGHLVVTSSVTGLISLPFSCSYNGSKHALHGYFNTLRMECRDKNLDVTVLCPGPVFSNFLPNCFTGKPGEIFGENMREDDKRMSTARCAYLSALAIANHLDEAWMGLFPCVPLIYLNIYYPNIAKWILYLIGVKGLMKMRDCRQTVVKED